LALVPADTAAADPVGLLSRPRGHVHSILVIRCSILCIIASHTSYRGMVLSLRFGVMLLLGGVAPCAETVRLWLLRLGLYLLRRPLPVAAGSAWAFLVDLTIQLGPHKCLVILGVPLASLADRRQALDHHAVHVLTLRVLEHSNGETVQEELVKAAARVGAAPQQIVSDHGSDVVRGINLYQQANPEVIATYDVTHQLALLLKAELAPDPRWDEFVTRCQQSQQQLKQVQGSFLHPPAWRQKARYLNLANHLRWAADMQALLSRGDCEVLATQLDKTPAAAQAWLKEKLGWLEEFTVEIRSWGYLQEVVNATEEVIKTRGLSRSSLAIVRERIRSLASPDRRGEEFRCRVAGGVWAEVSKIPVGKTYVGSTDVLESMFGKYKDLAERGPSREIGASVLGLAVLTAPVTPSLVKAALETITVADVSNWMKTERGLSERQKKQTVMATVVEERTSNTRDAKVA
jgi:hypothetical protein